MANRSIFFDEKGGLLRNSKPIDLAKFLKILFDTFEERGVAKFQEMLCDKYFTYAPPQMDLNISALMGHYNFRVMASVLGNNSTMPVRGTNGLSTWNHAIPRIGHKYPMDVNKLRAILSMMESVRVNDTAKMQRLKDTLVANVQEAYLGCKDVIDYIFLMAISNNGVTQFTTLDNPQGTACVIDYNMPESNIKVSPIEWSADNSAAGSLDILMQLQDICSEMQDKGIEVGEIMVSPELYTLIVRDKNVRKMILGSDKASSMVTREQLNAQLEALDMPIITKVSRRMSVEKDGVREVINPWNGNNVVFIPTGKLGEIQPAVDDSDIISESNVTYVDSANDGIKISMWSEGDSAGVLPTEYTQGSARVLPVITEIGGIYNLKVKN